MSHFLRGYFDGDGSICHNHNKHGVSFTSSYDFIDGLSEVLAGMGIYHNIYGYKKAKKTATIQINRMDEMHKAVEYLYKDATIYMDRKYQKYLEFKAWYKTKEGGKEARMKRNTKTNNPH